jgi:hypothetical protein
MLQYNEDNKRLEDGAFDLFEIMEFRFSMDDIDEIDVKELMEFKIDLGD